MFPLSGVSVAKVPDGVGWLGVVSTLAVGEKVRSGEVILGFGHGLAAAQNWKKVPDDAIALGAVHALAVGEKVRSGA